jgi:iron complex transport system permease protein
MADGLKNTTQLDRHKLARHWLVIVGLTLGLGVMILIALGTGRYPLPLNELVDLLWRNIFHPGSLAHNVQETVLFNLRFPRILAALMVGTALASAGACYQSIFRNPLVDPSLLGVSAGAAVGAALAILLSFGIAAIQLCSFAFGLSAVLLTMLLSLLVTRHGDQTLTLLLCGIVTGTLFAAVLSLIKYVADPYSKLPAITYWLMGSLAAVNPSDARTAAFWTLIGMIPLIALRWRINVLSLGDEEAKALGVDTGKIRGVVIVVATLMTATVVSISGIIGWVGLVVPQLARMLVGPSFRILLPTSALLGALFLLIVDTVARTVFAVEIPLSILTAIIGAPFFVYLLRRGKRGWV